MMTLKPSERESITSSQYQQLKTDIKQLIISKVPFATVRFANRLLDEVKDEITNDALDIQIKAYKSIMKQEEEGRNYGETVKDNRN